MPLYFWKSLKNTSFVSLRKNFFLVKNIYFTSTTEEWPCAAARVSGVSSEK